MVIRGLIFSTLFLTTSSAFAQSAGRVVMLRGTATVARGTQTAADIVRGDSLEQGDVIRTGNGAFVRILMADKSVLDLGPKSWITLKSYTVTKKKRSATVKVWFGRLWARVATAVGGEESSFKVESSNAVAGVRGTEFVVDVDETGNTTVTVIEGAVQVDSALDDIGQLLGAGDQGSFKDSGEPTFNSGVQTENLGDDGSQPEGGFNEGQAKKNNSNAANQLGLKGGDEEGLGAEGSSDLEDLEGATEDGGSPGGGLNLDPGLPLADTVTLVRGRIVIR